MRLPYIGLFIFILAISGCDSPSISQAKNEVASALKDPGSAEFRNVKAIVVDGKEMVCGEVNGKNSFGAMSGFHYFIYNHPLIRIGSSSESSFAIHSCCRALEKSGTLGEAKTTVDIEECNAIKPPMVLL